MIDSIQRSIQRCSIIEHWAKKPLGQWLHSALIVKPKHQTSGKPASGALATNCHSLAVNLSCRSIF
jgi:hypothetical protein